MGRSDARRVAVYVATVLHGVDTRFQFKPTASHRRHLSSGYPAVGLRQRISQRIRGYHLPSSHRRLRQYFRKIHHLKNKGCPPKELDRRRVTIDTPLGAVRRSVVGPYALSRALRVVQRNSRISFASMVGFRYTYCIL